METKIFGTTGGKVIFDELSPYKTREEMAKFLESLVWTVPTTDEMGCPLDPRKDKDNRNSFIKQQKLNEAKQARKDQMRRGKR